MSKCEHVRTAVIGAAALCVGAAFATTALGQAPPPGTPDANQDRLRPPVPSVPRTEPSDILGIGFAVLLGGAVVAVNAIPGRRGHQD